ncbi:hypothetical protein PO909_001706 [Leuciscus waleckii]
MAGGLDFGLAHFGISPAPQTEEIETSSTGGQHLLCREMQMETHKRGKAVSVQLTLPRFAVHRQVCTATTQYQETSG